jgi:hypothetical protein
MENIDIKVRLSGEQAWQLAQFLKRVSWNTCVDHTDNGCDESEALAMQGAFNALRRALADQGIAPR